MMSSLGVKGFLSVLLKRLGGFVIAGRTDVIVGGPSFLKRNFAGRSQGGDKERRQGLTFPGSWKG